MDTGRRRFLATGLGAGLGLAVGPLRAAGVEAKGIWKVGAFEKIFQKLSYDEIGRRLAAMGFQGIEATIRKGGHIEPERAADELPQAVADLKKHGCEILALASSINRADDPGGEKLLRLAKELGVTRYRMNYYRYDDKSSPQEQVREFRAVAKDLAAMNREIGVQGIYQNHAGAQYVGAALWDLDAVLGDVAKEEIGVALDLRHLVVESGVSWKRAMAMIRPRVAMVYVKDSVWKGRKLENVPLGTGMVTREVFKEAVKGQGKIPLSLHVEYFGGKPFEVEKLGPVMEAHERDLGVLRGWM